MLQSQESVREVRVRREMRLLRMWRMRSPSESVVSWLVSRAVPLETRQAGIAEANADYDVQPPSLVRRGAEIFCVRHRVSHVVPSRDRLVFARFSTRIDHEHVDGGTSRVELEAELLLQRRDQRRLVARGRSLRRPGRWWATAGTELIGPLEIEIGPDPRDASR